MSNYVDLAWATLDGTDGQVLCVAPFMTYIREGDELVIEYCGKKARATAIYDSISLSKEGDEYKFITSMIMTNKVLMKVKYKEMQWEEDGNE